MHTCFTTVTSEVTRYGASRKMTYSMNGLNVYGFVKTREYRKMFTVKYGGY